MINEGMMSSKEVRWLTPEKFYGPYFKKYNVNLDVCATPGDQIHQRYIAPPWERHTCFLPNVVVPVAFDGLATQWQDLLKPGESAWMNPPYGRTIKQWVQKARLQAILGVRTVCLLPSRTDTKWWHENCQPILDGKIPGRVEFIRGRIHFTNANTGVTGPAPFPSVVVIFEENR